MADKLITNLTSIQITDANKGNIEIPCYDTASSTTKKFTASDVRQVLPTVNDSLIQINQGGVLKGSFTLNDTKPTVINLDAVGSGSNNPTVTNLSGSAVTIDTMNYNTVYNCTDTVTSLTITSFATSNVHLETNIYFTTGETITVTFPSSAHYSPLLTIFRPNTSYVISVQNGIAVIGVIV